MGDTKGFNPSSYSKVVEQLLPTALALGANMLSNYVGNGDTSQTSSQAIPNFGSPAGPIYYGPGGGGHVKPSLPRKRRRRKNRRKKIKRRGRNRRSGQSSASRMLMPVTYSDSISNYEPMFNVSPTRNRSHGPSSTIAFSTILSIVGTNGVTTRNDHMNAIFNSTTFADIPSIVSGFLSTDGNWASGVLGYPGYWNSRVRREFYNWVEYRPRFIVFRFQSFMGTSTTGSFIAAFTRDPMDFFEANASATYQTATHNIGQVAETIPNTTTNVYRDFTLPIDRFDRNKWFPTEWSRSSQVGVLSSSSDGAVAMARDSCFGRLVVCYNGSPQTLANAGNLWVSGVLDVAGPTSSGLLIPTTQSTVGLMSSDSSPSKYSGNLVFHKNEWKHGRQVDSKLSLSSTSNDSIDSSLHEKKFSVKIPSSLNPVKSDPLNSGIGSSTWEEEGTP